jgi:hypothetical protein
MERYIPYHANPPRKSTSVIRDIDNRRDFGNSSKIYCTGRGRAF